LKGRVETMNLKGIELKSAIIGMVIGDGSLTKRWKNENAYFQMSHCERQLEYMNWKINIIRNITGGTVHDTQRTINGKIFKGYHFGSNRHPYFTKLHSRFYYHKIKVLDEYLVKMINPLALSIMYMDDGTFGKHHQNGKDSFFLCTNNFDYANQLLLRKSLKINFGIEWNLNKAEKRKDGTYNYRLRLSNRFNDEFLQIILPYVKLVPCMHYKLGSHANTLIDNL
jgi:hypothetical protein